MLFRRLALLIVVLAAAAVVSGLVWAAADVSGSSTPGLLSPRISDVAFDSGANCPFNVLTVTAHIVDAGQIVSATFWYNLPYSASAIQGMDKSPLKPPPPPYTPAPMLDDGLHGDGEPDDNIYGAVVEFITETNQVQAYLSALNGYGQVSTYPLTPPCTEPPCPLPSMRYICKRTIGGRIYLPFVVKD